MWCLLIGRLLRFIVCSLRNPRMREFLGGEAGRCWAGVKIMSGEFQGKSEAEQRENRGHGPIRNVRSRLVAAAAAARRAEPASHAQGVRSAVVARGRRTKRRPEIGTASAAVARRRRDGRHPGRPREGTSPRARGHGSAGALHSHRPPRRLCVRRARHAYASGAAAFTLAHRR